MGADAVNRDRTRRLGWRAPPCWILPLTLLCAPAACAMSRPAVAAADAGLPPYGPEDAALLDDTFGAAVFPTSALVLPPSGGKLLERVLRAECVLPVVVTTVGRQGTMPHQSFALAASPAGKPLAGIEWQEPITLTIGPSSPSYAQIVSAETTLVGTPLILLFRRYVTEGTETIHWRAEPDTPAVRAAVLRATAVRAGRAPHEPR
jgi:hypothetical protein